MFETFMYICQLTLKYCTSKYFSNQNKRENINAVCFVTLSEEKKYKEITIKQITLNKEPTV